MQRINKRPKITCVKNIIFRLSFSCFFIAALFISTVATASNSEEYDPVSTVMHHIANSNEFHLWGNTSVPLPCILYNSDQGFSVFMSNKFHHGHYAVDGYAIAHGVVKRIKGFPEVEGKVHLDPFVMEDGKRKMLTEEEAKAEKEAGHHLHYVYSTENEETKEEELYVFHHGEKYELEEKRRLTNSNSWYDFSISKNVFAMLLACILLIWGFGRAASLAKKRAGQAPKGIQSFLEPFFIFIRDEVTRPMIGEKHYERFQPFIMTLFFFILVLNLLGLIPFFPGSANVTGNLAVTMVLAVITFIVTNINGNRHYWEHVFWMPGVPALVKILIITPVEIASLFIKPFSLMIRLFANITAGHIIILSLVGLIFVFGNAGESIGGAVGGMALAVPFTLFMNLIEIIVAFIQAFIFAILSASYIGAAVEEHHHHEEHAH